MSTETTVQPRVGIVMGSISDGPTLKHARDILTQFDVPFSADVISAHRMPLHMVEYGTTARDRGLEVIIAGAGGAAHLPGMMAALTEVPVLGVPIESRALSGMDSLLSIVQMPGGVPTATFAIGRSGATNAALFAVQMLAMTDAMRGDHTLAKAFTSFRAARRQAAEASTAELHVLFEGAS